MVSPEPPKYEFEDTTLYETHRGVLRSIRKLLNPILKLFINPNPLIHALHVQKNINAEFHKRFRQREEMEPLYYEVIHNLVVELTRAGIEVHNLRMRVESLASRVEFDERRSRALESVVQYKKPPVSTQGGVGSAGSSGPAGPSRASDSESRGQSRASDSESRGSADSRHRQQWPRLRAVRRRASPVSPARLGRPGQGDWRRRRRRRRRRPGQTGAERGPGAPIAGAPGASQEPAGNGADDGDYDDGPDDGDQGPGEPSDSGTSEPS